MNVSLNPHRKAFFVTIFKTFAKISGLLILLVCFIGCGGGADKGPPIPENLLQISNILDQWRKGYETEDVNTYIGTFSEEGFFYIADMGTDADKTDDVEFDDIRQERAAATRVFERFQDIKIELSSPPEVSMNDDGTEAEVRNHYRIQFFVSDGYALEGGYSGAYAEGDNIFIQTPALQRSAIYLA